jgi:hypothetical protein
MYTHPETLLILSAELHKGLLAEAEHQRRLKAARRASRARHQRSRRNR